MRKHLHFIVVVSVLLVVMTWPTIVYVFDTDTFWLPTQGYDVWLRFWDAWRGSQVLSGTAVFNASDMLFYPVGISLEFHPYNVFHTLLFALLQSWMPISSAYNLIFLIIILATSASGYFFLNYLLNDKWLALLGAVIFGFSQHVVGHPNHPDVNLLVTVPLSLYALHRGVLESSWKWSAVCGLLVGITVFIGMYVFICLLLTVGMLGLYFATSRWRNVVFWTGLMLIAFVAAPISAVRIFPMMQNSDELQTALNKTGNTETANDLLASFVTYRHPLMTPLFVTVFEINVDEGTFIKGWSHTSYLGYLPLLLAVIGLTRPAYRRKMIPWLLLALAFLVLRLGSTLRFNGEIFSEVLLPKYYLDEILPVIFQAVHETDHFQIGVLFPLAVMSCYGLKVLLNRVPPKHRSAIVLLAVAFVAFEYYSQPSETSVTKTQVAFNSWLAQEPNQDEIHLINLPMGRKSSKLYGFYQTLNGYPHAEGLAMRTPASAYDYIERNVMLNSWREKRLYRCQADNSSGYLSAVYDLLEDGFSHIVLHLQEQNAHHVRDSFTNVRPAYRDRYVEIYRVQDLRDACADSIISWQNSPKHLNHFRDSPANEPRPNEMLLNFDVAARINDDALRYFAIEFSDWRELINIVVDEQGGTTVSSANSQGEDLENIATDDRIFWLISSPEQAELLQSGDINTFFSRRLEFCDRVQEDLDLVVERHIDIAYPCELITSDEPFVVEFDNGIQLSNALVEHYSDKLQLLLWWTVPEIERHAYSIQVFDAKGQRLRQLDDVIDNQPLSRQQIDISTLTPGDYLVNLIVYDYVTKQSQPGTILGNQETFRRELEIARFTVTP